MKPKPIWRCERCGAHQPRKRRHLRRGPFCPWCITKDRGGGESALRELPMTAAFRTAPVPDEGVIWE